METCTSYDSCPEANSRQKKKKSPLGSICVCAWATVTQIWKLTLYRAFVASTSVKIRNNTLVPVHPLPSWSMNADLNNARVRKLSYSLSQNMLLNEYSLETDKYKNKNSALSQFWPWQLRKKNLWQISLRASFASRFFHFFAKRKRALIYRSLQSFNRSDQLRRQDGNFCALLA